MKTILDPVAQGKISSPTAPAVGTATFLAVVFDRAHARFFEVGASETTELPCLRITAMRGGRYHSDRHGGPGWGEHDYHDRRREEARRHAEAIAEQIRTLEHGRGPQALILAGPGTAAVRLRGALPPGIAERVVGTARLNPLEVSPAVVQRTAAGLMRTHERQVERALVAGIEADLGKGRTENGVREVLQTLAKNQVRTLVVPAGFRASGFRCAQSGRLVLSAAECHGEGDATPVPDLVTAALDEARRSGASVVVVRDPESAKAIDGLAALLRFP